MGDYAYRKSDDAHIKIGTCGSLYYLTFDQWAAGEVYGEDANYISRYIRGTTFRVPLEAEKDIKPGDFDFNGYHGTEPIRLVFDKMYVDEEHHNYELTDFAKEIKGHCLHSPGFISMTKGIGREGHSCGIYASAPCYHGFTASREEQKEKNFSYNGFQSHVLGITSVGFSHDGMAGATLSCICCESSFCMVDRYELENFRCFYSDNKKDFQNVIECLERMEDWAAINL